MTVEIPVKRHLSRGFPPRISSPCVSSLVSPCRMPLGTYPTARKELRATKVRSEGVLGFPTLACHHPTMTQSGRQDKQEGTKLSNTSFLTHPRPLSVLLAVVRKPFNIYIEIVLKFSNAFYEYSQLTFSQ